MTNNKKLEDLRVKVEMERIRESILTEKSISEINSAVIKSFSRAQQEVAERKIILWVSPKLNQEIDRLFREELERQMINLK